MGRRFAAALFSLGILALPAGGASAMQFEPVEMGTAEVLIVGRGPIVHGDFDRFTRALDAASQSGRSLAALALDSAGGSVVEARQMVAVIRERRMTVALPHNTQCASACFLLFAASPRRIAATDALVGVHSASIDGNETDTSLAVTTLMARDAHDLGVPPAIIGKMVQTTPGRVEWLSPADLASMNVATFDADLPSALHRQTTVAANAALPPAAVPAPTQAVPPAPAGFVFGAPSAGAGGTSGGTGGGGTGGGGVARGRADRRGWDDWIASLHGAYRDGAEFARSRFPETRASDCYGPNAVNRGDFTLGCTVAQQRMVPIVRTIRVDPDYASGWNAPSVQSVAAEGPAEADYVGVYFCAAQVAKLNVKIFARSGEANRRALIAFGPRGDETNVPHGSFVAEGTIDTAAGAIAISPVKWVSQPPDFPWFGIAGRSDDGGRTFGGRVTENPTCTRFTLSRQSGGTRSP